MKNALTYTGKFALQQFCTFYIAYIMFLVSLKTLVHIFVAPLEMCQLLTTL